MADWTDSWEGFRSGMNALGAGRARKKQEQQGAERLRMEQERLGLEKTRTEQQGLTDEINRGILKRRYDAMVTPPTAEPPAGMRVKAVSQDADGVPRFTYEPETQQPQVLDVGGQKVIYNPNSGAFEPVKREWWETPMFSGITAPGAQVRPPSTPDQSGAAPTPSAVSPSLRMSGVGPSGPTFEAVYPPSGVEIVERELPGGRGRGMFLRSVDPKTGEEKLAPYHQPESANKISEKTVTQENMDAARRGIADLRTAITRSGTWESRIGNTEDAATLEQVPYLLAINLAKILDPGSVAREGEVNAAKRYVVPLGWSASKDVALKALDRLERELGQKTAALGLTQPGAGLSFNTPEEADAAGRSGSIKPGARITVAGRPAVWNP